MSNDPHIDKKNTLYPEQESEDVDDNSWQISYLDIVTILLGFLIILLSISHFTDHKFFSVSGLFKSDVEEAEYITTPINQIKRQMELALLDEIANNQIEIKRDLNDLLIRIKSDSLYLSGSATIQTEALGLLNSIVRAIQNNAYNDFNIDIEGHTDDVSISSRAYESNWELSTARATNVVKYFTGMGIDQKRLQASGYADSRPLVPNVNDQGNPIPENRAKNRRITLRLYYDNPPTVAENQETQPKEKKISSIESGCQYAVQLGGFSSFSNALNVAKQAVKSSNIDFNITYNGRLFSVRSAPKNDLINALSDHNTLTQDLADKATGLIHQCYKNSEEQPSTINFQIQLGAFGSQNNAQQLASTLNQRYSINSEVVAASNGLYRVISTTSASLKQTLEQADFLREELGKRNLISFADLNRSSYRFDFQIQLNRFQSQADASDISDRIAALMGLSTDIKKLEDESFILVSEKFENWEQTMQTFSDLSYTSYDLEPVIYLLENQE